MAGNVLNAIIIASSFILIFSQRFESEQNKKLGMLHELLQEKKNVEKLMGKEIPEEIKRKLHSDYDKLYGELHPKIGLNVILSPLIILLILLGFIVVALALHTIILFSDPDFASPNPTALSVIGLVSFFIAFILIVGAEFYLTLRKMHIFREKVENFKSALNYFVITTASKESSAEPQTNK